MSPRARVSIAASIVAVGAFSVLAAPAAADDRRQSTQLISRAAGGGVPNGPSTNGVISNDRRFARLIAFQSDASDIVPRDTNGRTDVFAVRRDGPVDNTGKPWRARPSQLISRSRSGRPANGDSFAPAVSGGFTSPARCVAFLSSASNLVRRDTNGVVDAFVVRRLGRRPARLLLPGRRQPRRDVTQVAVSGDCSRVAFVSGGRLFVVRGRRTRRIRVPAPAADPSFSTGKRSDLVFGAPRGVYLSRNASGSARLIAPGGSNPAYNDIKRRTVAYEVTVNGRTQIGYRDVGDAQRLISSRGGQLGNGDSRDPVIGNSGFYVAFESAASNLSTNAAGARADGNGRDDVYLFTDVRDLTLVQSVEETGDPLPGGGANPSMSFYANYMLFDSPAPLGAADGPPQVFMRYLGGV